MSSHKIALVTDSTCDIPENLLKQFNIYVVPQIIIWGTEEILDRVDIQNAEFYKRLPNDPQHPSSSQPAPQQFETLLEQAKTDGASEVLVITVSGQMSATINSAQQAAEDAGYPVQVVDSMSVSMGLGLQVLAAAEARESGADIDGMIAAAETVRKKLYIFFSVDTLEYLHRGGRIGGAAKLFGTALQLKPMLYIDHAVGRIEPGERTRTRKKAVERMYETFFDKLDTSKPIKMCVLHSASEDEAIQLADRVKSDYSPAYLMLGEVGPIIGVHGGPGILALVGYNPD